jgi:hypothetical protein
MTKIVVEGWRAGADERREAAAVPANELPVLNDEQKEVAKKLGISEESYARSTYAGRRNQERLLEKTRRFAQILMNRLGAVADGAKIERIRLVTVDHEYKIEISLNQQRIHFRVPEEMVDDLVEGGSTEVESQIVNRLQNVLAGRAA